jgi:hypothetical protein
MILGLSLGSFLLLIAGPALILAPMLYYSWLLKKGGWD